MPSTPPKSPTPTPSAPATKPARAESPNFDAPAHRITAADGLDNLLKTEWLLTNGLGGFAMGTASGVPARRYHGLLVAATSPPVGRIMALSAMVETLELLPRQSPRKLIDLSTFRFGAQSPTLHPNGHTRLKYFEKSSTCRWVHEVPEAGVRVVKELQLLGGINAATITYTIERTAAKKTGQPAVRLSIRPLTALRDMHALIRRSWADRFESFAISGGGGGGVRTTIDGRTLYLQSDLATFAADPQWWYDFFYQLDAERGQDCLEDLYSPGEFSLELPAERSAAKATIQASIEPLSMVDRGRDATTRDERLNAMLTAATASGTTPSKSDGDTIRALITAADDFIVARRPKTPGSSPRVEQTSIIAGYPWFADWGRDTSIALHGLMLATGRFADAKRTLLAFSSHRRNGIVPNVFNDQTGEPEYNTVDASLWFILGACAYLAKTADRETWDGHLAPACLDIVAHYRKGTEFNIAMDPFDKLITAGTSSSQLTWMDAKRDGVAFTPRHGKAVEINALWCSALRELCKSIADTDATMSAHLSDLADAAAKSFRNRFWNPAKNCLFDRLTHNESSQSPGWTAIDEMRPNQLFAVSLPHSPLSPEQQKAVVASVRDRLLTPFGVRTLDPADPNFRARYEGNLFERDRAYHNGTAWPWLLGPYAESVLRTGNFSAAAKAEARAALAPIIAEMSATRSQDSPGGCLGQIAEVYDATEPQRPQGCPAQAWSVAEVLRVFLLTA